MPILKFVQVTPTGGDCCAGYEVTTGRKYRNYTINELIEFIITETPDNWGTIRICPVFRKGDPPKDSSIKELASYNKGEIKSMDAEVFNYFKEFRPFRICSNGGWTSMDYDFYVKI